MQPCWWAWPGVRRATLWKESWTWRRDQGPAYKRVSTLEARRGAEPASLWPQPQPNPYEKPEGARSQRARPQAPARQRRDAGLQEGLPSRPAHTSRGRRQTPTKGWTLSKRDDAILVEKMDKLTTTEATGQQQQQQRRRQQQRSVSMKCLMWLVALNFTTLSSQRPPFCLLHRIMSSPPPPPPYGKPDDKDGNGTYLSQSV